MRNFKFLFGGLALLVAMIAAPAIAKAEYWVLKNPGITGITSNPAHYEKSLATPCNEQEVFCGFIAPENGDSGMPVITPESDLYNDLEALDADPTSQTNDSGSIHFQN